MEKLPDERLFSEFPPVSTDKWEEKIRQDLKRADYAKKLIWKTQEGFDVKPYYRAEDLNALEYLNTAPGHFPYVRGGGAEDKNGWEIRQDIAVNNITEANGKALELFNNGISSPGFRINPETVDSLAKFSGLLQDIPYDKTALHFSAGKYSPDFFNYLMEDSASRRINSNDIRGTFDYGPLNHLNRTGEFYTSMGDDFSLLAEFLLNSSILLPRFRFISVDGSVYSDAGSSVVQELAFTLSAGAQYLEKLTDKGLPASSAASAIHFTFGTGSNYFMEIAKLRAARLLWAKIVETYNPETTESARMQIHAVTARWNQTLYDPHVNILRATTESMSAVLGGADSLTVLPFDAPYAGETELSLRIARNIQIILKEEAYFGKVTDPAGGSYYIENLTGSIAGEAWKLFLKIEEKGGYIKAFTGEFIPEMLADTTRKRLQAVAERKEVLLGTNQYADFHESGKERIGRAFIETKKEPADTEKTPAIGTARGSQEFEKLRIQTETSGRKRPVVFLLTIGNIAMRKARAAFSANFFACAGYEIIDTNGFKAVGDGVSAALNKKADIIVLCSGDDEYDGYAPEAFGIINGRAELVIAGDPPCRPELEARGIRNFISLRSNLPEILKHFHKVLKIT